MAFGREQVVEVSFDLRLDGLAERPQQKAQRGVELEVVGGDVEGKRPGFTDMVGRAKFDAWNELKGKSADEAMQDYIDLIESLK